jgi:hypothetical protein
MASFTNSDIIAEKYQHSMQQQEESAESGGQQKFQE